MLYCKEADDREKRQVFLQVHEVWPHAADPNEHLTLRLNSIQHQRATWYVGLFEGEVVTSLGVYPYTLYGPDGHRPLRVFGAVFTLPAARDHGYAQQLLRWVMSQYREAGVQDFALFSDIGAHYYQQFGFQVLPSFEWEFDATQTHADPGPPLKLEPLALRETQPGYLGCAYGLERSREDDRWVQAKQTGPLRLVSWGDKGWLLSRKQGEAYILLESNLSQEADDWPLFRQAVVADARASNCRFAQGWWTASAAAPAPEQREILPRDKEILMWTTMRGPIDAWFEPISKAGFRVFLSEHV